MINEEHQISELDRQLDELKINHTQELNTLNNAYITQRQDIILWENITASLVPLVHN